MNSLIDLLSTAHEIQEFCDSHGWGWCFICGIAVQRWSQARVTRDVDLTLLTGFGGEVSFIKALLAHHPPRYTDSAEFALRSRVLLLNSPGGIEIDISLGALPFEHLVVQRSTPFEFAPGISLHTCSAEDLIVMKLFASRAIDIRDAEGAYAWNGAAVRSVNPHLPMQCAVFASDSTKRRLLVRKERS